MRLCVSNIAWLPEDDEAVAGLLAERGVTVIEAAPTLLLPSGFAAGVAEIARVKAWWLERGISIGAFQALLFGRPDLTLFGDPEARAALAAHLETVARLAGELGAGPLVFGSPKNRLRGGLAETEALKVAAGFLHDLGERIAPHGATLCIEPLGEAWGCDFARTLHEAAELARAADHPAVGVNADLGALATSGEEMDAALAGAAQFIHHTHVSEPGLAPVGEGGADVAGFLSELAAIGYAGLVSIEMRRAEGEATESLGRALDHVTPFLPGAAA